MNNPLADDGSEDADKADQQGGCKCPVDDFAHIKYCFIVQHTFSLFAAICNLLGMILPNCAPCGRLSYDYLYSEDDKINSESSTPQQLLTAQPQNEMPLEEEAYPDAEEIMKSPINQRVTPNISDTNPGYDIDNRYSVNSLDAAAPIYQVQNNDDNNQENISYPKPQ